MQELLRHSSLRSTLDIYTQALTPAKHEAQGAVLLLVFSSDANPGAFSGRQGTSAPSECTQRIRQASENGRKKRTKRALFLSLMVLVNFA